MDDNLHKENKPRQHDNYRTLKKVGQGNFGSVYLVQSESNRKYYILKIIQNEKTLEKKQNILREVKIMKALHHQYIIAYRESFLNKNKNICIVMEYAEAGDLAGRIAAQRKLNIPFEQQQILQWFIQICFGLKYIHENKIVHRDLKCQNVFLTAKNECKIGDFGISKIMEQTFDLAKTKIGTPYSMAPEIWQNYPYNQKSDIWSLGCILYELCTLKHPFIATNAGSFLLKITEGKFEPIKQDAYSKEMRDLVAELLNLEPQHRPSVQKILDKEFIKKRISITLSKTFSKYSQTLDPCLSLLKSKNASQSSGLQCKRSLSNSIKQHEQPLSEEKIRLKLESVEMQLSEYKQSYPIVLEENKILKSEIDNLKKQKEQFQEAVGWLLREAENSDCNTREFRRNIIDKFANLY